ncbi:MAG: hypothetical protein QW279_13735 [Candidatus Jordarchaeaceae archaeon]
MKRQLIAIGIIIIICGTVISAISEIAIENIQEEIEGGPLETRNLPLEQCYLAGNFSEKEKIIVKFTPRTYEEWKTFFMIDHGDIIMEIDVIPPSGNETTFRVTIIAVTVESVTRIAIANISVVKEGDLIVENPLTEIKGTIPYNGTYIARIKIITATTPSYLTLIKGKPFIEKPYKAFLPLGIITILAGVLIIGYAKRIKKVKKAKS